jgi:ribonuclease R
LKILLFGHIIGKMSKFTIDEIKKSLVNIARPLKIRELARNMGVRPDDYPAFRRTVKDGISSGQLVKIRGGRLATEPKQGFLRGKLLMSRAGHGFVIPDDKSGEIYISPRDLGGALNGEEVKLIIKDTRAGKNREGKIIGIIDREKGRLVGHLYKGRYGMYIIPNDPHHKENIEVDNPKNLILNEDLIVTIRLYPWEATYLPPRGYVEEILGKADSPGIDIDSLVIFHGLPRDFDPAVKAELNKIRRAIPKKELARRRDLRDLMVFTIDPADAKDHDDAISLEPLKGGRIRLGVHIADVSHYVREGMTLDREARLRGNSVYLVDRVIPMLPQKLSSDICSLVENEDRLTVSFMAVLDSDARVLNWEFVESVIRSHASLNYDQVQRHFDARGKSGLDPKAGKALDQMLKLSQALRAQRLEKGSLDFDLPEPTIELDSEGRVLDIFIQARMPSHQVVEEFMLLANRYAASYLGGIGAPILYRVHARPEKEKIENFAALLREMGYDFSFRGEINPKKLQRVLEVVKGKPEESFVEEILLRSLAKAVYQPENIGHFGLAFPIYAHYTSPIRRYPDLLLHRMLKLAINRGLNGRIISDVASTLKGIGAHCTATEIAADEAERDSIKIKQLEYLFERVGGVYDGIISGVVRPGFFVELVATMVEGFVPFNTIRDDYFVFEEGKHRAFGRRTGRIFKLGDKVRVLVVKVDMENRRADFALVNSEPEVKIKKIGKRK